MDELPSWHSKGGGFSSAALGHRPQNRAKGADPRTGNLKGEKCFCPVFCLLPVLACLCLVSPGSGSRVPRPCPFGFLFVLVPPHVSFYWPRASRSSSQREGRRVKRKGTDPRTGLFEVSLFTQYFLTFSLRCSRWCCTGLFSTVSMFWVFGSLHQKPRVGGTHHRVRRDGSDGWRSPVPRGDNTGGRDQLPPQPTIAFLSRRQVPNFVMDPGLYEMAGPVHSDGCNLLVLALCSLYASGCGFCHYQY